MAQDGQSYAGIQRSPQRIGGVVERLVQAAQLLVVTVPSPVAFQQSVYAAFAHPHQQIVMGHPVAVPVGLQVLDVGRHVSESVGIFVFGHVRQPVKPVRIHSNLSNRILNIILVRRIMPRLTEL